MHVSPLFTLVNYIAIKLVGVVSLLRMRHAQLPNVVGSNMSSKMSMLVICCVLLTCTLVEVSWGLKIAAFNIQTFGPTKMGKPDVVASLVQVKDSWMLYSNSVYITTFISHQIVRRYDIALLQEIRDISATNVIQPFLAAVNRLAQKCLICNY